MNRTTARLLALSASLAIAISPVGAVPAMAAPALTITPITWDVIGLDSNSPATGPNRFPVGARVCSTGSSSASGVTATFSWDSANAYVALRPGSLSTVDLGTIAAGDCADAYFEVEIARNGNAYDTVRRYHITATDSGSATATTPRPRQLYVEHLISQNRNGITSVALDGTLIPAGGTMTLVQGRTYDITMAGYTATQGYNQLEAFTGLPNTVFQVLSVNTTFTADSSPYVGSPADRLYADACGWDPNPDSPNYRSCIGGDGKAGGTVVTTYHVRIVGGAGSSETLGSLLYDFSGSSFHYNADFGVGSRIAAVVSPASIPITKTFTPKVITPGSTSVLTVRVTNPTPDPLAGITWADTLPAGMTVAGTPGVTITGCGAGAFSPAVVAGATSLHFSGGTVAGNGTCSASVTVTAPAGTYSNTTGHLFIDTDVDTGNTGHDTLTAAAAASCTAGVTLASWTVPTGTTADPPDTTGGLPTVKGPGVGTATIGESVDGSTAIITTIGSGDSTSWSTWGYKNAGQYVDVTVDTSKYSSVGLSYAVANPGGANGPKQLLVQYSTGGAFTTVETVANPAAGMTVHTVDLTGVTSTTGTTVIRFTGSGALNDNGGANLAYDNVTLTGCHESAPAPTLAKAFAPDTIVVGDTSTLTFTLTNTAPGNTALTGVAFSDVLPAGLSVASSSSSHCGGTVTVTAGSRTIALAGGSLAAGGSCSFPVTVTGSADGVYDNVTGFVSTTEGGTSTSYATDSITVIAPPTIAKDFSPASILVDATTDLSFTVGNPNGASALHGITFTDSLPAGLTAANDSFSACGGTVTVTAPDTIDLAGGHLAAGATCTFGVPVTGATTGTKVNTTGTIDSTEGGPGGTATATVTVSDPVPSLDLQKQISTDGTTWRKFTGVETGADVFYRFALYNSGEVAFTSVDVTDPDVAGCTLDGAATPPLAPGETVYCTTGAVTAVTGLHVNTAFATGTWGGGSVDSDDSSATYGTTGLTLDKQADRAYFVDADETISYTLTVTNTGFAPLLGPVSVTDPLSADEACPSVTTTGDGDAWLDPGESLDCTATYTTDAGDVDAGLVTNTASATADGVTTPDDSATVRYAALQLVKTADDAWFNAVDDVLHYTYVVTNTGSATLAGPVTIADDRATDEACADLTTVGDFDTDLDPGESVECTASDTVLAGDVDAGHVTNTATASADGVTSPSDDATVGLAALSVSKTSTTTSVTHAGQVVPYVITVSNAGEVDLTTVDVTDPTCDDPPAYQSGDSGEDGILATGESWEYICDRTVTQAEMNAGGTLDNTATADSDQTPPTDATKQITIDAVPALTLVKAAVQDVFTAAADVLDYTYAVTNTGPTRLAGPVTIDDDRATDEACPSVDTVGNFDGWLDPGETIDCTASDTVDQGDVDAGIVTNVATASAGGTTSNEDKVSVPLAALSITKDADTTEILHAGHIVTYTLDVTNDGAVHLTNLDVQDPACDEAPAYASGDTLDDGVFEPGETWTFTCERTVTQDDMDGVGDLENTATAWTTETGFEAASHGIPVTRVAAMTVTKDADLSSVSAAGQVVTYTIVVDNTGTVSLTGITVDDPACDDAPAYVSGDTGDDGVLGIDEAWTYTCQRTVTQADIDTGGSLENTATADSAETGPVDGSHDIAIDQAPALSIVKSITSGASFVKVGDIVTYAYLVTNTGNVTVEGPITVDDDKTPVACPDVEALAPGDELTCTSTYAVTTADVAAGFVTNTALARGSNGEVEVRSAVVAVSAHRIPVPSEPPTSTLDPVTAPAAVPDGGWLLGLGIVGLVAFSIVAVAQRRPRAGRRP